MKFLDINPMQFLFAPDAFAARPQVNPKDPDYDLFVQLKKAISEQGLLNHFSVSPREGGYMVLDGNCRALAIQQLWAEGNETFKAMYPDGIKCQVFEMSDADVLLTQISGNANVKKQKAASLAKALYKALLMTNITITELARRAGLTEAYTEQLIKINTLPDHVKAAIDAGEITATNAFHLNRLPTKLLNAEMIDQAKIKTGADFCNLVDEAKKAFLKAKKEGTPTPEADGEVVFHPTPKLRAKNELEGMYKLAVERKAADPTEANIAYAAAMEWCFRMDEDTLDADRRAFVLAQEDKKKKAEERKAARADKQRKELLESLASDPKMKAELAALVGK